jgi:hypothetical protein
MGALSIGDYYGWQRNRRLGPKDLRSRTIAQKWLHSLSMKLCYSPIRPAWQEPKLVAFSLNLTMFFRILANIYANGYPAHWLADTLSTITKNWVQGIAHPPRSFPYAIKECKKDFTKA